MRPAGARERTLGPEQTVDTPDEADPSGAG